MKFLVILSGLAVSLLASSPGWAYYSRYKCVAATIETVLPFVMDGQRSSPTPIERTGHHATFEFWHQSNSRQALVSGELSYRNHAKQRVTAQTPVLRTTQSTAEFMKMSEGISANAIRLLGPLPQFRRRTLTPNLPPLSEGHEIYEGGSTLLGRPLGPTDNADLTDFLVAFFLPGEVLYEAPPVFEGSVDVGIATPVPSRGIVHAVNLRYRITCTRFDLDADRYKDLDRTALDQSGTRSVGNAGHAREQLDQRSVFFRIPSDLRSLWRSLCPAELAPGV